MTKQDITNLYEPYFIKLKGLPELRDLAKYAFEKLPEYWFEKPASSSGKYHPKFANLVPGGLALHTLAACRVWDFLYRGFGGEIDLEENAQPFSYEIGLVAVIFHDALKYGDPDKGLPYTTKTHDRDSATWFLNMVYDYSQAIAKNGEGVKFELPDEVIHTITGCITHHMGPWSTDGRPKTLLQKLVFIADFVASSKYHEEEVFNVVAPK